MVEALPANPSAKMPLVLFPTAEPEPEVALAAPTPDAVELQEEYVYLLRVVEAPGAHPNAKIPLVLFPAAEPC